MHKRRQRGAKIPKKPEKRHAENDAEIVMAPKRGPAAHRSDFSEFFDHRGRRRRGRGEAKAYPRCWLDTALGDLRRSSHPGGVRRIFDAFLEAQKSEKSDRGAAKRLQVGPGTSPENGFSRIWIPGAARARLGTR